MELSVNGARLHVERTGRGEPLLWITGFTISSAVFGPILPRYAERFDNVVFDNRHSGRSAAPLRPTSMPELAADAAGVLDRLGLDSAHVYGLSMGGMVAQELALRFPERVRGLVLGGTSPGGPSAVLPTRTELAALGAAMAGGGRGRGRPWLAGALFSDAFRREHPERVRELLRLFRAHPPSPAGVAAHWWATVYHDTVSRLPRIQAPTLVMHGELDALAPVGNARLLAERIPGAELALVPGAGHAYPLEAPEASYALLADWLDRQGTIAPGRPRSARAVRWEPVTRPLGLPIGMARTGASLTRVLAGRRRDRIDAGREREHVATER
jgi:pimeloyl-ACP methyl ester carboxylesterase